MANEPNAAGGTPTRSNWTPLLKTFNGGKKKEKRKEEKLLKGRRLTSLSEGRRGGRLDLNGELGHPDFFAKTQKSDDSLGNEDPAGSQ